MKIVNAGVVAKGSINDKLIYGMIESAGRTCYKSTSDNTFESSVKFINDLIQRKHEAVLEHAIATLVFTCDRGVSHEIVRHRIAAYAQESTRYCNYSSDKFGNEITVIKPCFWEDDSDEYMEWYESCQESERRYFNLLRLGATPQEARSVLPNSLKTEIVVTFNIRQWRHFFNLRYLGTAGTPHPQMFEVAEKAFHILYDNLPIIFEDIRQQAYVKGIYKL